jgi:PAS domain S-box-containing protein
MQTPASLTSSTCSALRIAVVYCTVAILWILFSDELVTRLVPPDMQPAIQTLKGMLFVAVTTGLLFFQLRTELRSRQRIADVLQQQQLDLEQRVMARTAELSEANALLSEENKQREISEKIVQTALENVNALFSASSRMVSAEGAEDLRQLLSAFLEPLQGDADGKHCVASLVEYETNDTGLPVMGRCVALVDFTNTHDKIAPDARFKMVNYPLYQRILERPDRPISIPDVSAEKDIAVREYMKSVHARALVIFPLATSRRLVGQVNLMWGDPTVLGDSRLRLLRLLAPQLATILENRNLFNRIAEAELRYRLMAENALDVISRQSPDGICSYISPSCKTVLGYEPEEIIGHSVFDLIHPDDVASIRPALSSSAARIAEFRGTFRARRKDGRYIWFETTSKWVNREGIESEIVAVSRDITARREAQQALQHARDELEQRVSERTAELTAANQLLVEQIYAREDAEKEVMLLNQQLQAQIVELESINRVTTLMRGVLRNARTHVEMLPVVLEQVNKIFSAEGSAFINRDIDSGDLQVEVATGAYVALTGQVLKQRVIENVVTTGEPFASNNVDSAQGTTQDYFPAQDILPSVVCVPLITQERVLGILWFGRSSEITREDIRLMMVIGDIVGNAMQRAEATELLERAVRDRTAELAAAYERLKSLDKLKSKFVSDVSHELRTPVTNLAMMAYLLSHDKPENRPAHIASITAQIGRLKSLLENILNLSRLEKSEGQIALRPVNINETVSQTFAGHVARAEAAGLTMTFEPADHIPLVIGEPNQIGQVAENLIANAINYTPKGSVEVRTFYDRERRMACLSVQDTGMGIDEEDIPNVYNRFFRGQRASQAKIPGTGLGLGIVKEIVEMHSGHIDLQSKVGEGTKFTVSFPIVQDE